MKLIPVIALSVLLAAFISTDKRKSLPPHSTSALKKIIKPITTCALYKDECRAAFLLNTSKTDSVCVGVRSCEGITYGITVAPGGYVTTDCLSTDYGIELLHGNVVVDWMQMCP